LLPRTVFEMDAMMKVRLAKLKSGEFVRLNRDEAGTVVAVLHDYAEQLRNPPNKEAAKKEDKQPKKKGGANKPT